MGPVFNPANAVTASRYLTLPAFLYHYDKGNIQVAALVILLCAVIDLFDGAVARIFKCSSGFGELFDAITDGICYSFFLIVPALYGQVSWIPVAVILGAGVVNSLFRAIYAKRAGRATNYRSYAMERCVAYVAYTTGAVVTGFESAYFVWTCAGFILFILAHDAKRMLVDPVPA
jgi:phosphatidylglycerophosphate synthase